MEETDSQMVLNKKEERLNNELESNINNNNENSNTNHKDNIINLANDNQLKESLDIKSNNQLNSSINSNGEEKKGSILQYTSQLIQTEPQTDIIQDEQYKKTSTKTLNRLIAKLELQEIFANAKEVEKQILKNKIISMKQAIQELHSKFEIELNKKDKMCMDKLFSITKQNEEIRKKETDYIKKIRALDDMNKALKSNISSISKEKMDLEDVIFRQEDKLSILSSRVNQVDELLSKKNRIIKENEAYAMELIVIVEEQKKEIKNLKTKSKVETSVIHYQNNNELMNQVTNLKKELEEKNKRIKLYEADTSAIYLKNSNYNPNQIKDVYDEGAYQNNNITGIGINYKSLNENEGISDIRAGNINSNDNTYLPPIGVKNSHNTGREKLDEFKSMMNQLIDEMNE